VTSVFPPPEGYEVIPVESDDPPAPEDLRFLAPDGEVVTYGELVAAGLVGEGRDTAAPPKQEVYPAFVEDSDEGRFRFDMAVGAAAVLISEPPESKHTQFCAGRLYLSGIET
jgi:hypothetical protein